jgi:nucleoid-associated protein EbfC
MQFRGGINELMRQAARIQRKVEETKAALKDTEVTASAVGDKVKATVTLGKKLSRVEIDPEFMKAESFDLVLDGVCAAVNAGFDEAEKALQLELDKVTGGAKIPGLT